MSKPSALQASLDDISTLLARDKALEEADPAAWQRKQFNPANEPDAIYDPLAKFETQLRAYKEGKKEFDLEEYDRLNPAPAPEERVGTLTTAADDVSAAGGRVNAEQWNGTAVEPTDLSLQALDPFSQTKPNWFQRNVLRQKEITTGTEPKFELMDVEDLFADWEDGELDHLEQRVNLVEDQIELRVDQFKDVALNVREQLVTGDMDLADVKEYIKTEMDEPLKDFDPWRDEDGVRWDDKPITHPLEDIAKGDLPVLDVVLETGLPDPPAAGETYWENNPDRGGLGRNFERMPTEQEQNAARPIEGDDEFKEGDGGGDPWEADDIIAELERLMEPDDYVGPTEVKVDPHPDDIWANEPGGAVGEDPFAAIGNEDLTRFGPMTQEMVDMSKAEFGSGFESYMIRNNPNYYVQQAYDMVPEVNNPISPADMNVLEYHMNVIEPGGVAAFEMDALESGQAAARIAQEAGEGFWATIWSGLKKVGGL